MSVVGHRGRVATQLLLHYRHTYAFAPDVELFDSSSTECVGSTEDYLIAGFLELVSEFSDSGSFAYAVYADHHDNIWVVRFRNLKVIKIAVKVVFGEELGDLFAEQLIELSRADLFVALYTSLDTLNDFECGLNAYIAGDEDLFKVVEHIVVNLGLACNCVFKFAPHPLFSFLKTCVELFFLFA